MTMSNLYLAKIGADLPAQLQEALEFIGWEEIVPPGATVFVKPNLGWPEPRPGVTTSPRFVEALLGILASRSGRLFVGESNGGTFAAEAAFASHGLPEICELHGAQLVNLSGHPATIIEDTVGGRGIQIEASRFLLEDVDVFVTLPVLKTHVVTQVTLGLKNQWGCIPTEMRLLYHHILDWGIVALNRAYKPRICILDGTYAMDRRGPLEGDPIPAGWMAVSDDVVALDSLGCHLLDMDPHRVRHVRFAAQEGLGTADLARVQLNRELPPPAIHAVVRPNLMDWIAIVLYRSRTLSRLVFASPLTPVLYRLIRRTPPGISYSSTAYAHPAGH
ncbi:MAG TPA: DUF362 domain-containing protein [Anaerolineae bacterium]|nr:DUF362 domain-containing protein [Anaerolineae bacterium]